MLLELYIILLVIGIILFILGVIEDGIAYYGTNLVIFLILIAGSFNIEQKFITATNATNYSIRTIRTTDYTMNAFLIIFIFIDLVMMAVYWFHMRKMKRGDIPYVPGR